MLKSMLTDAASNTIDEIISLRLQSIDHYNEVLVGLRHLDHTFRYQTVLIV
jgi:hypothetical protein